jgi:hypothetical protein
MEELIEPYCGPLVDLTISPEKREDALAEAAGFRRAGLLACRTR